MAEINLLQTNYWEKEIYVAGYLFPLLRYGIAPHIAEVVDLHVRGRKSISRVEIQVNDDLQLNAVIDLLKECYRQVFILREQSVSTEEIGDALQTAMKDGVLTIKLLGTDEQLFDVKGAHMRLYDGKAWFRALINKDQPDLKPE